MSNGKFIGPSAAACLAAAALGAAGPLPARAQSYTETVLHSFGGSDGSTPYGAVVLDKAGNLYGTTVKGGAANAGTIFKIAADGTFTTLYSFKGSSDGANPYGGPIKIGDYLYGTTYQGGALLKGVIYKLRISTGTLAVLHTFDWIDGVYPLGSLVADHAGNVFGAATHGGSTGDQCFGSQGCGTVFEYSASGTFRVLYSFNGPNGTFGADVATPASGLIVDSAGNLYGAAEHGPGATGGGAYVVQPNGDEQWLCGFPYSAVGAVTLDGRGDLFGSLQTGGGTGCGGAGCGSLYEITSADACGDLYNFPGGAQGDTPLAGMLLYHGIFYGTTSGNGKPNDPGTVFSYDPGGRRAPGTMTVLHRFTPASGDGAAPGGGTLARDKAGNLYGTTQSGGAMKGGTVYKLSPVSARPR